MNYRELIRKKREEKGISQNQLAKLLGISQPYMNQIETGSRNPTLPLLMKICDILEIPMFGENTQNE
ncbi:MAG TPA: helix-turn-helix domain-containing protein [Candidatus Intestinimonas pullistercoris]|uniref:Helix-turn-helix domain-containing protein n=1 Tax=Candidatus Intestinimonas pullistercoris TaxID=2838623 RepID=A0A9D2P0J4_9FIRM|nr:helix-turn-helix transcriptional regulator [uncultured Intestinimonas sp.]HJC41882.1 helix-turn-helix domain-containing protein [Candidatus Intestinimonas pullistercoris]